MRKHKLCDLVVDFDLYPRRQVDAQHTHYMVEAIKAGAELPPLVIDKASKRISDGFHRYRAYGRVYGENHKVECVEKDYANEGELFLDAVRYNAAHGRSLTTFDRTHCIVRATELSIEPEHLATAMHLTTEKIGELKAERIGEMRGSGEPTPLKRTIKHMHGQKLSKGQAEANTKLSGMQPRFYINQLVLLLENDLVDWNDLELSQALDALKILIGKKWPKAAA